MDSMLALEWLRKLRWVAVCGQLTLLTIAQQVFHIALPYSILLIIITITTTSNILLHFLKPPLSQNLIIVGLILCFDVLLLTALLHFSGGASNPFSILYLVHVILAAVLLGKRWTWIISALSTVCFALLFTGSTTTLHNHHLSDGKELDVHLQGMWFAYLITAALTTFFLTKILHALQDRDRKIQAMTILAARQEKLAALTTLAAGAAHELNSPLGTIAIIASELERASTRLPEHDSLTQDIKLIQKEVNRCTEIISRLSAQSGEMKGEMPRSISISSLATSIVSRFSSSPKKLDIAYSDGGECVVLPEKAVINAVSALISNAFDASDQTAPVSLRISQRSGCVTFTVEDRGTGISEEILKHIGEPFFTTKPTGYGMGLGVFLSRLVAERLGGQLSFSSRLGRGTTAVITFRAQVFEGR